MKIHVCLVSDQILANLIPALVERPDNGSDGQGSITAFFTVLTEGDDLQDPIADAARAILDGHIVLAR